MTTTLNALQALIDAAYDAHFDNDNMTFIARLERPAQIAVLVQRLTGQVYNGGWAQWIYNGYGASWRETLGALRAIGTPSALAAADLVSRIAPTAQAYADDSQIDLDHLDQYDQPMWDLSDQLLADTAAYLGL